MRDQKYVMIPGPTPVARSIQDEMGREIAAFGDPAFIKDYKELLSDLKTLWHCDGEVFVVAGTGTLAMEMAVANTTKRGDKVLCVSNGFFGDRMVDICTRKGLEIDVLQAKWGSVVSAEEIDKKLAEKEYACLFVTHVDTSTGAKAPVARIGEVMKKHPGTLYIVDGVCSTAAEPEYLTDMNIDILFTGTQKAFGVCPGLLILWAGKKALERRTSLGMIAEYYVDFEKWLPVMQDTSKYFATPAINLVWALKESVRLIKEEGLENRFARHEKAARATQAALEALGFTLLAEKDCRAVTLSNPIYPEGIQDGAFRGALLEEGVVVAGGLAAYAGKMFRIGHMGNIDGRDLTAVIGTIEKVLIAQGANVQYGQGVSVLEKGLK